jgi:hypothetical protein
MIGVSWDTDFVAFAISVTRREDMSHAAIHHLIQSVLVNA